MKRLPEPGQSETRRNLRLSSRDGGWYCIMSAIGESNIAPFGVAIGLSSAAAGLLDTVPKLCGSLLQLSTHAAVTRLGSHKRWILITASTQALIFLPLALGGLLGWMPPLLIFALAAVYWGAAWACSNTWSTFISTIVPRRVRPAYFSQRNRWLNVILVIAMLTGGWILASGRACGQQLIAFAAVFGVACCARLLSTLSLARQSEPVPIPPGQREVGWREMFGRYRHGSGGRLLIYRLGFECANQISTPFLVPYLLKHRGLQNHYEIYAAIMAAPILSKGLIQPLLGRIAHNQGPRFLLRLGGLAVVPLPLFWLMGDSVPWMLFVQIIAGIALGAHELACFLMMFDTIPENERTSVLSKFVVGQFSATLLGSLAGGFLLHYAAAPGAGEGSVVDLAPGFVLVFAASALARLFSLILLSRVPTDIAPGEIPTLAGEEMPPLAGTMEQGVVPIRIETEPISAR